MTNTIIAQSEPVLVANDISKARHEVLIALPGKKRRRRLTVLNQLDDFNRLVAAVAEFGHPVRGVQRHSDLARGRHAGSRNGHSRRGRLVQQQASVWAHWKHPASRG
jgi:hypothetical protein